MDKRFLDGALGRENRIGNEFKYRFEIENKNNSRGMGMIVMIFRVPSCLDVNYQLLDAMLGNGEFDKYEVLESGTEVVIYWTYLPAR